MRRLACALLLFSSPLAHAADGDCTPADFSRPYSQTTSVAGCFVSAATGGPVRYRVTFPAGYRPEGKLPFAIFLHGRDGSEHQFEEVGGAIALDDYVTKHGGRPFVVVAPAEPKHSYWKDGPRGEFGTLRMVADDLVAHVEGLGGVATGDRNARAIFGISMGGHGSLYVSERRPDVFSSVYAVSPVFRAEKELEAVDRAAFGNGPNFRRQDPVRLFRAGKGKEVARAVEMGCDDWFLGFSPRTRNFLTELDRKLGPGAVNFARPGGHDVEYWRGAIQRALDFLGGKFGRP